MGNQPITTPLAISIYLWLYSHFVEPWQFFRFLNSIHSQYAPFNGGSAGRKLLPTHKQHKYRINTQTSMPLVGIEPTIPVFERTKNAATVIGPQAI
jgi:hypothetical protein